MFGKFALEINDVGIVVFVGHYYRRLNVQHLIDISRPFGGDGHTGYAYNEQEQKCCRKHAPQHLISYIGDFYYILLLSVLNDIRGSGDVSPCRKTLYSSLMSAMSRDSTSGVHHSRYPAR